MRRVAQARAGGLAKTAIARDAAAEHDRWRRVGSLGRLDAQQEGIDDRLLVAGGEIGALLLGDRGAFADLVEQRRLHTAEAEVEAGSAWPRKADRPRISLRRQRVDRGAAGKRQTQDARPLVEGLASGIIECPADHADAAVRMPSDQVAVAAGYDQAEDRRVEVRLLEQRGEDMGGEVADPDHRQLARPGDRLPEVDADEQATNQAGAPGYGDTVDLLPAGRRGLQGALDHRHKRLKVGARGKLRHDPAVGRVQRILGTNHVREQARAGGDNRCGGLITGGLDRQDAPVRLGYCGVLLSSPSISSVCRISLKRFLKPGAWIESDHITIASSLLSV